MRNFLCSGKIDIYLRRKSKQIFQNKRHSPFFENSFVWVLFEKRKCQICSPSKIPSSSFMLWLLREQLWICLSRLIIWIQIFKTNLLRLHWLPVSDSQMALLRIQKTRSLFLRSRTNREPTKMSSAFDALISTTLKMFPVNFNHFEPFWPFLTILTIRGFKTNSSFLGAWFHLRIDGSFWILCSEPLPGIPRRSSFALVFLPLPDSAADSRSRVFRRSWNCRLHGSSDHSKSAVNKLLFKMSLFEIEQEAVYERRIQNRVTWIGRVVFGGALARSLLHRRRVSPPMWRYELEQRVFTIWIIQVLFFCLPRWICQ